MYALVWPFCESAQRMKAAVLTADGSWDHLDWASTMEEFSKTGVTVPVKGKDGLGTNIWYPNLAAVSQRAQLIRL